MKRKMIMFSVIISNLLTGGIFVFHCWPLICVKIGWQCYREKYRRSWKNSDITWCNYRGFDKRLCKYHTEIRAAKKSISESYEGFDLERSLKESGLMQYQRDAAHSGTGQWLWHLTTVQRFFQKLFRKRIMKIIHIQHSVIWWLMSHGRWFNALVENIGRHYTLVPPDWKNGWSVLCYVMLFLNCWRSR